MIPHPHHHQRRPPPDRDDEDEEDDDDVRSGADLGLRLFGTCDSYAARLEEEREGKLRALEGRLAELRSGLDELDIPSRRRPRVGVEDRGGGGGGGGGGRGGGRSAGGLVGMAKPRADADADDDDDDHHGREGARVDSADEDVA